MKKVIFAVLLFVCILALAGCGIGRKPGVHPSLFEVNSRTESAVETTIANKPLLGIIAGNSAELTDQDVMDICAELGLSYDSFKGHISDETNNYQTAAANLINYGCKTLIFAAKGSADVAKEIRYYYDVQVYVTEAAKDKTPQLIATYDFSLQTKFQNGLAWCTYKENGDNWLAVINEDFKIIYHVKDDKKDKKDMVGYDFLEDGYAYYKSYLGDYAWEYVIIDTEGNEIYRTENTEDTKYSICGHGDGVFIITKEVKNITENAVYISIMSADGETIFGDQKIDSNFNTGFVYYGEGIFQSYSSSLPCGFVNSRTGAVFEAHVYDKFLTPFIDGWAFTCIDTITVFVKPHVYANKVAYWAWREKLSRDDSVNRFTPKLSYQDPIQVSGIGYGSGGYYPVQLQGADGKAYFTIVDKDGVQQFEPFRFPGFTFSPFAAGSETVQEQLDARFANGIFTYLESGKWYVVFPDGTKTQITGINKATDFNAFDGTYLYLYNRYASFYGFSPWSVVNVLTGEVHEQIYLYDDLGA